MIVLQPPVRSRASTSDLVDCVNFRPARARLRRIRSVSFQDGVLEAATRGSNQSGVDEFTPQIDPGPENLVHLQLSWQQICWTAIPWLKLPDTGCSSKIE